MKNRRIPLTGILLIFLLVFQTLSALYGGIQLILDPSGMKMQMPVSWLKNSPFHDFLIPGLILTLLLGLLPGWIAYCLTFRPFSHKKGLLNIYPDRYFAWTYSLYLGIMLMIWITVQIAMVGYGNIIQTIYAALGILITIVTLIPSNMEYYSRSKAEKEGTWRTL
jgi:hypothetical protein